MIIQLFYQSLRWYKEFKLLLGLVFLSLSLGVVLYYTYRLGLECLFIMVFTQEIIDLEVLKQITEEANLPTRHVSKTSSSLLTLLSLKLGINLTWLTLLVSRFALLLSLFMGWWYWGYLVSFFVSFIKLLLPWWFNNDGNNEEESDTSASGGEEPANPVQLRLGRAERIQRIAEWQEVAGELEAGQPLRPTTAGLIAHLRAIDAGRLSSADQEAALALFNAMDE